MESTWRKFHITLKIGIILLLIGTGPLFIVMGLDKLGLINAGTGLGVGLLAVLSFFPSIILIIIGSVLSLRKRKI